MSTKIYNGYKLTNVGSVSKLNQFYLQLRKAMNEIAKGKYAKYLLREMVETTDNLCYLKATDEKRFKDVVVHLYRSSQPITLNSDAHIKGERMSDDECFEKALGRFLFVELNDIYYEEIKSADIKMQNDPDLDYSFSICVMPLSDDVVLFTAYGDELINYLNEKIKNDNEFCEEYGLSQYYYWNNTDQPDDISYEEWERIGKDWDIVLAKGRGIPAEAGMAIDLFDITFKMYPRDIIEGWDTYKKLIPSKKKRVEEKVLDIMLTKYINGKYEEIGIDPNNMSIYDFNYSRYIKWKKEFMELYNSDEATIKEKEETREFVSSILPTFNRKILSRTLEKILK